MANATDEELMIQYQEGSIAAFDLLYLRYEQRVYSYLLRLIRDREQANELFQDTFLNFHQQRHRYEKGKPLGAWIFTIARNLAFNKTRTLKRQGKIFEKSIEVEKQIHQDQENPEEIYQKQSVNQQLDVALESLPVDQREAITLSYYGGLKYEDIAQVVGTTHDAIKQRVRRGFASLRDMLIDLL